MNDTLARSLMSSLSVDARAFLPELFLCGAIVFMLLVRLVPRYDRQHLGWVALLCSLLALLISVMQWPGMPWPDDMVDFAKRFDPRFEILHPETHVPERSITLFGGMLVFDNFTIFIKLFLYSFVTLVTVLTLTTGIPDREDSADFYCLLFGSTIGMSIMASSSHLLMVFIGIEMASLPSYAMAGFLKGRRQSSEAALKYVVYGGGASGVMLYGISLLAGHTDIGSGHLPNIIHAISTKGLMTSPIIIMALTFILAGIGFKLAAVPFHFWCPDVFEGAAAEVGAFLSVASKGAALALLARIVLGFGGMTGDAGPADLAHRAYDAWSRSANFLVPVLALFAIVTTTFGNLAAYGQTNLKRLLAYSTIAHAGFMMMGLAALTREGAGAMLFYLIVYLFMNLGAFAVVAYLRNITGQEDLTYYRGFVYRSPVLVITLGVFLLSLLGLPPLAGFAAKFQILSALFDAAQIYEREGQPMLSSTMYALVVAGGLNTVLSLFYYVKVLKVMVLEKTLEEVENRPIEARPTPITHAVFATVLAGVILGLGLFWNPLSEAISTENAVNAFRAPPTRPAPDVERPVAAQLKQGAP
jgi:NADH-quinone oxidoreductase subunit N